MAFTLIFFAVFSISERFTRKRGAAHTELDQFNLEPGEDLTPDTLGVRPGNVLIMVRDYNTLYNLGAMLDRVDTRRQDIVVLHMRLLARAASGEHELTPEQLFSGKEQELFTRALALAEKKGKTIHLRLRRPRRNGMAFCALPKACDRHALFSDFRPHDPSPTRLALQVWLGSAYLTPSLS